MRNKIIGFLFVILGAAIISFALIARYDNAKRQTEMIKAFEEIIEVTSKSENIDDVTSNDIQDTSQNITKEKTNSNNKSSNSTKNTTKEYKNIENIIGLINIPKIDLKVPISEDVTMENLKHTVSHFKKTAAPGEKGNCCIAGHRSYTYNEYFNRLDELEKGDEVIIKTKKGNYTYIVYDKLVVEPKDIWVLDSKSKETSEITLVTCTPIRIATHRLIIKGRLKTS